MDNRQIISRNWLTIALLLMLAGLAGIAIFAALVAVWAVPAIVCMFAVDVVLHFLWGTAWLGVSNILFVSVVIGITANILRRIVP